jgi:hypothetical protein
VIVSLFITWIALVIVLVLPTQTQAPPPGGSPGAWRSGVAGETECRARRWGMGRARPPACS